MIEGSFPWVWFGPVLVSLRYGVLMGMVSAALVIVYALGISWLHTGSAHLPLVYLLGGLLLTLLVGEFAAVWHERTQRKEEANLYLEERLTRLTRRFLLMKLSHDRLEQEMLSRPGSLRSAIHDLRQQEMADRDGHDQHLPAASALLGILSQYCLVEEAALYPARELVDGVKLSLPLAMLGRPPLLSEQDALLHEALRDRALVHVGQSRRDDYNAQLLVAPLYDAGATLVGVLAVRSMPFFALNEENLQLLLVILSYYTDTAANSDEMARWQQILPSSLAGGFLEEMARLTRVAERTGVNSHLLVIHFTGAKRELLPAQMLKLKRGLDLMAISDLRGMPALWVLMPFATPAGVEGFLLRLEDWLHERHQTTPDACRLDAYRFVVGQPDLGTSLTELIQGRR